MNLYLIEAKITVDYDSYDSHVVLARSPKGARHLCPWGDEGNIWSNPKESSCEILVGGGMLSRKYTEPCVILSSFNAG